MEFYLALHLRKKERKGEFVCLTNNWKGDYLRSSLA